MSVDVVENAARERGEGANERLLSRIEELEDRLWLTELELSSSVDSGVSTGHTDAYHGGAICDENRREIISASRDSNSCRDIFITQLTDRTQGRTRKLANQVLFNAFYRFPVCDGNRFVYFSQYGDENNRFGRFDLESNTFDELARIPGDHFASPFSGCFHHGSLYYLDCKDQLCRYDVERGAWSRCCITLPTFKSGSAVYGHLLSDPTDAEHLYYLAVKSLKCLYRIDLRTHSYTPVCPLPWDSWLYNTILIRRRPGSDGFVIITSIDGGSWYMFSSKTNTWKPLPKWKTAHGYGGGGPILSFLVYLPQYKTFYYHVHGRSTWEMVQI